jgi:hypothetical protein
VKRVLGKKDEEFSECRKGRKGLTGAKEGSERERDGGKG